MNEMTLDGTMKKENSANLVRKLRDRLDLTQEQFAQKVGVTYSTVNHWENGKRTPQPFLLRRLQQLKEHLNTRDETSVKNDLPVRAANHGDLNRVEEPIVLPEAQGVRREVRMMVERIIERFHPERIILFGSHARGEATPDSDVDLLVIMDVEGSKREAQLQVRNTLHDIRISKDIIVSTPEEFSWRQMIVGTIERQAVREGKVQYVAG